MGLSTGKGKDFFAISAPRFDVLRWFELHPVLLQPCLQAFPPVFCGSLAIAGPVIGVEGMGRVGIDMNLGLAAGLLDGGTHGLHIVQRDALVLAAVKPEYRPFSCAARSSGCLGVSSLSTPSIWPYQATAALRRGLWAA